MNTPITVFANTINSNESQTRFLVARIESLEKNLLEIHSSIASYAIKIAKTRDMADILAQNIVQLSDSEKINNSLRQGLTNFADCLNAIQDFRDDEIKQIEDKVINDLSIYGELTKRAKEELKFNSNARSKQLSDLKEAKFREMVRSGSFNEVTGANTAYELQIQKFERKKINDLKKIFLDFTKSELLFHSKTIEMLTKAYRHLLSVDTDKDLQEFCMFFNFTQLGSPKRDESIKTNEELIETTSTLRRFNSAPNVISIDSESNENRRDSKSIDTIVEHLESDLRNQ